MTSNLSQIILIKYKLFLTRCGLMVRNLMINEKLDDQRIVEKIICYLSARIDYVVAIIEKEKEIFTLTIEELISSLCSHEQRMNQRINSINLEQALQSRASTGGCGG